MEQQTAFPIWAVALAAFAAAMFLIIWIPYNRRRTRLLNRFGPQQPPEQQPLERPKEDPQNTADKAIFYKLLSYIITVIAIGYLIYFYCFLEPGKIAVFIWACSVFWLSIFLIPTTWIRKNASEAAFLLFPLTLASVVLSYILYNIKFDEKTAILIYIIGLFEVGLKYNSSAPGKFWKDIESPKHNEDELSNWIVLPVMFVMAIVVAFILWFVIGMALHGRLFTG